MRGEEGGLFEEEDDDDEEDEEDEEIDDDEDNDDDEGIPCCGVEDGFLRNAKTSPFKILPLGPVPKI